MASGIHEAWRPDTLVYDRDCELCRWSQGVLSAWDREGRIRYLPFQDPQFERWFPDEERDGPPRAIFFIDRDRRLWVGVEAFRRMLPYLPYGKLVSALFYLPGARWASKRIYEWVARNRYRFGRVKPRGNP